MLRNDPSCSPENSWRLILIFSCSPNFSDMFYSFEVFVDIWVMTIAVVESPWAWGQSGCTGDCFAAGPSMERRCHQVHPLGNFCKRVDAPMMVVDGPTNQKDIHGSHLSRVSEFLFLFFRWNRTLWKLGNFFQKKILHFLGFLGCSGRVFGCWWDTNRTILSSETFVIGPLRLIQGGIGAIARRPLFTSGAPMFLPDEWFFKDETKNPASFLTWKCFPNCLELQVYNGVRGTPIETLET